MLAKVTIMRHIAKADLLDAMKVTSAATLKPANDGHLKTGQRNDRD